MRASELNSNSIYMLDWTANTFNTQKPLIIGTIRKTSGTLPSFERLSPRYKGWQLCVCIKLDKSINTPSMSGNKPTKIGRVATQ